MAKEQAIWAELEKSAPQSVADFKVATEAMDAQNYDKAIELFQRVRQQAPKFDAALRRLGGSLVSVGKTEEHLWVRDAGTNSDQAGCCSGHRWIGHYL